MAEQVIIGMDPHKRPVTFEARDSREILPAAGRLGTPRGSSRCQTCLDHGPW
jgi:hypothetical protein